MTGDGMGEARNTVTWTLWLKLSKSICKISPEGNIWDDKVC